MHGHCQIGLPGYASEGYAHSDGDPTVGCQPHALSALHEDTHYRLHKHRPAQRQVPPAFPKLLRLAG